MDKLLELLMRQPMILVFVVIWLIGMVSNAMKAQKKVRERRDAATRPQPMPGQASTVGSEGAGPSIADRAVGGNKPGAYARSMGTGERKELAQQSQSDVAMRSRVQQPIAGGGASDQARPLRSEQTPTGPAASPGAGQKSPEQIAREMRRLLGLEPDERVVPEPNRSSAPLRTPPPIRQEPERIETVPAHVRAAELRDQAHIQSHVGETLRDRHMSKSRVGQTKAKRDGGIGNLGGRVSTATKVKLPALPTTRRYAMDDLRRVIVMNEILLPPVALRPDTPRLL